MKTMNKKRYENPKAEELPLDLEALLYVTSVPVGTRTKPTSPEAPRWTEVDFDPDDEYDAEEDADW